ncbi:MAG: DUF695 domain-containing protein [Tahibacter sp.]
MKIRYVALMGLAFLAGCSGPTAAPSATAPGAVDASRAGLRHGSWRHALLQPKGRILQWDLRDDFSAAQLSAQPNLLVISSHYRAESFDAPPSEAQQREFHRYEDALLDALKGKGELVAVMAGGEQYDWYFYSDSGEALSAARTPPAPSAEADVAISVEADPQGDFYTKLRSKAQAH